MRPRVFLAAATSALVVALAAYAAEKNDKTAPATKPAAGVKTEKAIFAGGCFWCEESTFEEVKGVIGAVSGYTGGSLEKPTYENHEGHAEAVEVEYDPSVVSYDKLLDVFWRNSDPTDDGGQFCDRGDAYRSEIFTVTDEQQKAAEASKANVEKTKPFKSPIVTKVVRAGKFWPAEDYHQDYYKKNPVRYKFYVTGCGRYDRLDQLWGALRKK